MTLEDELAKHRAKAATVPTLWDAVEAAHEELMSPYPPGLYNGSPPSEPKATASTSAEAAQAIRPTANSIRGRVLARIIASGGMTDDEVETTMGLRHQTASARRRELVLLGLVVDSGRRRLTRSGRRAVVWVAA